MRSSFEIGVKLTLNLEGEGQHTNDPDEIEKAIRRALYFESNKFAKNRVYALNRRNQKCTVDGCDRQAYAKGLCNAHGIRIKKGKDLLIPIRNRKLTTDKCIDCGEGIYLKHGAGLNRCPKHFKKHRGSIIKQTLIKYFGSKCVKCGGEYSNAVFDFHHTSNDKDIGVGNLINSGSIKQIALEASKCILLCANCHREVHHA